MALTFLLFLIVTYWFSLAIYILYYDNFEEGEICQTLSICFLRVFDYMFKEGGGVGSFMSHPNLNNPVY